MKELSVGEQRYQAVMAVLSGGRTVTEVARDWAVSRQTMHAWLARYERAGMEGMGDRSHRPSRCHPPDGDPRRGAGPGDAAPQAVLGPASTGPGVGQERRDPDAVGLRDLSLPAPGRRDSTGSET